VRDDALAKTRRPYGLLAEADLTPVAGEFRGQMISRATLENTRALAELISTRTSRRDVFAISTFDSFRIFDPVCSRRIRDTLGMCRERPNANPLVAGSSSWRH
jgi:hypothetical protein